MTVNKATINLIKKFEGWRSNAYPDPASGGSPWTIGYGHTTAAGLPTVGPGLTITKQQGEEILQRDLVKYEDAVISKLMVDLTDNQFGALVSFTYNVGPTKFNHSSVLRKVNEGLADEVPSRLLLWNKAKINGVLTEMSGLTKRRKAEGELFMTAQQSTQPLPDSTMPPPVDDSFPAKPVHWIQRLADILSALVAYFKSFIGRT